MQYYRMNRVQYFTSTNIEIVETVETVETVHHIIESNQCPIVNKIIRV